MLVIFLLCVYALLCSFILGFIVTGMVECGFNIQGFFLSLVFYAGIILCIVSSYFVGVNTTIYYCQECGYKTDKSEIQYCPNDGNKLEIFVKEDKKQ